MFFLFYVVEVPDLTHEVNVELFRGWDQKEVGYLQILRYIRISGTHPERLVVSRHGQHPRLVSAAKVETVSRGDAETMDTTEV